MNLCLVTNIRVFLFGGSVVQSFRLLIRPTIYSCHIERASYWFSESFSHERDSLSSHSAERYSPVLRFGLWISKSFSKDQDLLLFDSANPCLSHWIPQTGRRVDPLLFNRSVVTKTLSIPMSRRINLLVFVFFLFQLLSFSKPLFESASLSVMTDSSLMQRVSFWIGESFGQVWDSLFSCSGLVFESVNLFDQVLRLISFSFSAYVFESANDSVMTEILWFS